MGPPSDRKRAKYPVLAWDHVLRTTSGPVGPPPKTSVHESRRISTSIPADGVRQAFISQFDFNVLRVGSGDQWSDVVLIGDIGSSGRPRPLGTAPPVSHLFAPFPGGPASLPYPQTEQAEPAEYGFWAVRVDGRRAADGGYEFEYRAYPPTRLPYGTGPLNWHWAVYGEPGGESSGAGLCLYRYDSDTDTVVELNGGAGVEAVHKDYPVNRPIFDLRRRAAAEAACRVAVSTEGARFVGERKGIGVFHADGSLIGIDVGTASVRWQVPLPERRYVSLYRHLVVGTREEYVEAWDVETGRQVFSADIEPESWSYTPPVEAGDSLYVSPQNGLLVHVEIEDAAARRGSPAQSHAAGSSSGSWAAAHNAAMLNRWSMNIEAGFRWDAVADTSEPFCRPTPVWVAPHLITYGLREGEIVLTYVYQEGLSRLLRWAVEELAPREAARLFEGTRLTKWSRENLDGLAAAVLRSRPYYDRHRQAGFATVYLLSSRHRRGTDGLDDQARYVSVEDGLATVYDAVTNALPLRGTPVREEVLFGPRHAALAALTPDFPRAVPAVPVGVLSARGAYLRDEVEEAGGMERLDRKVHRALRDRVAALPALDRAHLLETSFLTAADVSWPLTLDLARTLIEAAQPRRAIYYAYLATLSSRTGFGHNGEPVLLLARALAQLAQFESGERPTVRADGSLSVAGLRQDRALYFGTPESEEDRILLTTDRLTAAVRAEDADTADELMTAVEDEVRAYLLTVENEVLQTDIAGRVVPALEGLVELHLARGDVARAFAVLEVTKGGVLRLYAASSNRERLRTRLRTERTYADLRAAARSTSASRGEGERGGAALSRTSHSSDGLRDALALEEVGLGVPSFDANTLGAGATLVAYYEGQGTSGAFILRADAPASFAELDLTAVRDLLPRLSGVTRSRSGSGRAKSTALLSALHTALVSPLSPFLRGPRLVVVPTGRLYGVPFGALFDGGSHLIDQFEVDVVPSATTFELCMRSMAPRGGDLLLLRGNDPSLSYLDAEEAAVRRTFGGPVRTVRSGNAWTHGERPSIVHIAAHGYFDAVEPLLSHIDLSRGRPITVLDVYERDLDGTGLALVHTCVAGESAVYRGDELFGLTRGFLVAGCPSIVTCTWALADEVGPLFAESFYSNLDQEGSALQAYAHAVRCVKMTPGFEAPYYWGGTATAVGSRYVPETPSAPDRALGLTTTLSQTTGHCWRSLFTPPALRSGRYESVPAACP